LGRDVAGVLGLAGLLFVTFGCGRAHLPPDASDGGDMPLNRPPVAQVRSVVTREDI
jgi:hypothetical protein